MKKFTSEELQQMVFETIDGTKDTNFTRTFDFIWSNVEDVFPDDMDVDVLKENINNLLQLYTQMVVMESVNLTLNALKKTGTLVDDDYFNS